MEFAPRELFGPRWDNIKNDLKKPKCEDKKKNRLQICIYENGVVVKWSVLG
jgi:hypothetical protein